MNHQGPSRSESMVALSFMSKEKALSPENHQVAITKAAKHCATCDFRNAELNGEIH